MRDTRSAGQATGRRRVARAPLRGCASKARRGVLLLIVLSVLALFAMLGLTFVLVASHAQRAAQVSQRSAQVHDSASDTLAQATMQVLRGTSDPGSVLGAHSLLEEMYGNGWVAGTIQKTGTTVCGGQLVEFTFTPGSTAPSATYGTPAPALRVGCVITVTDRSSPLYGQSSRIVGFSPSSPGKWHMLPLEQGSLPATPLAVTINGVPFSGTGFGFNTTSRQLNDTANYDPATGKWSIGTVTGSYPVALLPNLPLSVYYNATTNPLSNPTGGANSDYTAVDHQHMLLAMATTSGSVPVPSLHRPELVNYWYQQLVSQLMTSYAGMSAKNAWLCVLQPAGADGELGTADDLPDTAMAAKIVALKRAILMRPLAEDHPKFTGSNATAPSPNTAAYVTDATSGIKSFWERGDFGSWDVDNDGDGVPDSIWVDLGMPVRATVDGRLYKPLFAIRCLDLDGRANLNAHGCLVQTGTPAGTPLSGLPFAGGAPASLPRGLGYGPAEISLRPVLGSDLALYQQILAWRYPADVASSWLGGVSGHRLGLNKWFAYGGDYWNAVTGAYGSPPDMLGNGAIGVDWGGRPMYVDMGQMYDSTTSAADCPYEYDLSPKRPHGSSTTPGNCPFSLAELERLLRPYDTDTASLPTRLAAATASAGGSAPQNSVLLGTDANKLSRRHAVTTESWDVPCPGTMLPADKAASLVSMLGSLPASLVTALQLNSPNYQLVDLMKVILASGARKAYPSATDAQIVTYVTNNLPVLVSPDLLVGRRMDLNRPLGNARDDASTNESLYASVTEAAPSGYPVSYDPTGLLATNSQQARQLMARYLYVLATQLADLSTLKTQLGGSATEADVARFLAQWAVNVVDARSGSAVMTPFYYDPEFAYQDRTTHPIAGWTDHTGDLQYLVWGCKRPELLLTETLAFHDRRTEDLSSEQIIDAQDGHQQSGTTTETQTKRKDSYFDSRYRPEGSLYVELYNPWSTQEPTPPELANTTYGGVNLGQVSPTGKSPVWRLITVDGSEGTKDPDDATASKRPTVERAVYFAGPTAAPTLPNEGKVCFRPDDNFASRTAPVLGGRYALVGPGDAIAPNRTLSTTTSTSYLSFKPGHSEYDPDGTTRRIVLAPNPDPAVAGQVGIYNDGVHNDLASVGTQPPVAVIINKAVHSTISFFPENANPFWMPPRLSISEPNNGYPYWCDNNPKYQKEYNGDMVHGFAGYLKAWDHPLDQGPTTDPAIVLDTTTAMKAAIRDNKRTDNIKVIHLQRLANPLMPYDNNPASANYNPYRTLDSMPVDLTAFNGIYSATPDPQAPTSMAGLKFYARQRGHNTSGSFWTPEPLGTGTSPKPNTNPPVPADATGSTFNNALHHSLSYLNNPSGTPSTTSGSVGDPQNNPLPLLIWNARPFISGLELLLVPRVSYRQLTSTMATATGSPYSGLDKPFAHLPSFFASAKLYRILEYVDVPSRFVGTELQMNPTSTAGDHIFHTPFNRIPSYREPGRINLNTLMSEEVFQGLVNGYPSPSWSEFCLSRQGPDYATNPNACPTRFGRPFRSSAGSALALGATHELDETLLRPSPTNASVPLFQFTSSNLCNDPARNPAFYYQGLERLGNLVTTRSNVYAVWITVGYFEVEPAPTGYSKAVYPDGYRLGRELGSDTGEVKRHRGFTIIDRTIPVGFQRGQDLNADKAILVNRFIE